jgi:peptidoglycan/xylan/chitin deacetylase (PgdA/CDA1 family)
MFREKIVAFQAALLCCFVLSACQTINQSRDKITIPEKAVILTFDDGPNAHEDTTARLLDVLKKYHIHAMFALLGENAQHNPGLVRCIYDEGHTIINHGFNDKFAVRMEQDEFENNLVMGENAIISALGENLKPRFYRPQGGFYKKNQQKIWEAHGYVLAPSTIRTYDAAKTAIFKGIIVSAILEKLNTGKGGIIILHDARDSWHLAEKKLAKDPGGGFNRSWIPDLVEEIIIRLLEKGYYFADIETY